MPWVIASQTIPILAIAPTIIVVLGAIGIQGLIPKALISTYLSFFPVVVGMVKGFRSPESIQLDLMHTYNAGGLQNFFKLRWPIALPYLFASMKVGIAASLVGAIVGELPAGGGNGLGARLLAGSYYGQTIQIWSSLAVAATLAGALVVIVGIVEGITVGREALAAKAAALQSKMEGLVFTKAGPVYQTLGLGYLAWALGPDGGDPVATGYARLLGTGDEFVAEVPLGEDGGFRFFAAPGDWTLRVLAPGS